MESYEKQSGQLLEPSVAELAASGYRDAGASYLDVNTNAERFKHLYREACLSGYHQAYYAQAK